MARRRRLRRPGALSEFPPLRIVSQIAALQGIYYAAALVLTLFTALAAGTRFGADLVFGWEAVRGDTTAGWLAAFVGVLEGFCLGGAIVVLVTRSKLVPDFAITTHVVHLVVCTLYTGELPRNTMWWASMGASTAVAALLGVWGCRYRELQPISFGGARRDAEGGAAGAGEGASAARGSQDDQGAGRGRGRGRGRDGGGEYEMVRMNEDPRTK